MRFMVFHITTCYHNPKARARQGLQTHDHRLTLVVGIVPLLYRSKEHLHIDVEDDAGHAPPLYGQCITRSNHASTRSCLAS